MKILFVSQSFYPNPGGVSTLLLHFLDYAKNSFDYQLFHLVNKSTTKSKGIWQFDISKIDKEIIEGYASYKEYIYRSAHGLKVKRGLRSRKHRHSYEELNKKVADQIIRLHKRHKFDLIHYQDYQLAPSAKHVKKYFNGPLILSLHAPLIKYKAFSRFKKVIFSLSKPFDKVIVSSSNYEKYAVKVGIEKKKLVVIPPFTNPRVLVKKGFHSKYKFPKGRLLISIQRFDSKSGQMQLIKAMPNVLKEVPDAHLILVGAGSFSDTISSVRKNYYEQAKERVKKYKLTQNIHFAGKIDYFDLLDFYKKGEIFCLTSKIECFSVALLEAMYFGKALVATNTGGFIDQIKNNRNGILVPVKNERKTAEAIVNLLKDDKLRKNMATSSKMRYRKLFAPRKVMRKYLMLYKK